MFWIAESKGNLDMADQEEGDSLVCLQSSEAFPLKPTVKDDPGLGVPYHKLCGESVTFLGRASEAIIALSTYRLLIRHKESFVNVPVMQIESVECRDMFYLVILCKDGKTYRCKFATNEQCQDWLGRLTAAVAPPSKLEDVFAFAFHAWCFDQAHHDDGGGGGGGMPGTGLLQSTGAIPTYSFMSEVRRQGYDLKEAWRVFENKDYKYCASYPVCHVVPAWVTDEDLKSVASFRASKRFPSIVWRHQGNGAVIARCSQPEIGWFGWRCDHDERFMENILRACSMDSRQDGADGSERKANGVAVGVAEDMSVLPQLGSNLSNKKVLIVDARSYTAAWANRAKGGGCEFPEYYPSCDIQFMGLANIHSIRKSLQGVRSLCSNTPDGPNWLSLLEATKWLQHLSLLLKSATTVASTVDKEACPVVVHCSDGWDRTPQIVALAELMLDPYYRTLEGFQVLVEREWLDFGHKFGDRCGHKPNDDDVNQRSPIFLQWLDCVHQLLGQFPTAFEFNQTFLVKLAQHTYSCLFGTFLCNSAQQRVKHSIKDRTCSVWSLLGVEGHKYRNFLFAPAAEVVLQPCCHVRSMHFWTGVFVSDSAPASCEEGALAQPAAQAVASEGAKLTRTRSVDDLHKGEEESRRGSIIAEGGPLARRLSDPSLGELKLDGPRITTPPQSRKVVADRRQGGAVEREEENEGEEEEEEASPSEKNRPLEESESVSSGDRDEGPGEGPAAETRPEHLTNGHVNGFLNGDCSDSDSADVALGESSATSTPRRSPASRSQSRQSAGKLMKGSTDTLTDELGRDESPDAGHWNGCNGHAADGRESYAQPLRVDCELSAGSSLAGKQLAQSVSISTSTSDLTCSNVVPPGLGSLALPTAESASLPELAAQAGFPNGDGQRVKHASSSSIPSFVSAPSSPLAPSSDGLPGPAPGKWEAAPKGSTSGLKVGRHLDEDGLTSLPAPAQERLLHLMQRHTTQLAYLQQEVVRLQKLLQQTGQMRALFPPAALNGVCQEVLGGELEEDKDRDASCCGSFTSDISWEQVDETETRRTLWMPDYAATHCFKCNAQFNVVFRKHHCRSCGQVFCSTCTGYMAPIPHEQLYQPERVCRACYDTLDRNNSRKTQMAPGLG